jgi:hypothetical protein
MIHKPPNAAQTPMQNRKVKNAFSQYITAVTSGTKKKNASNNNIQPIVLLMIPKFINSP